MDNEKKDFDEYQPGGAGGDAENLTGWADNDHDEFDCLEDLDMEDMDYGKTLLSELDRIERELKALD
ncbi:MAG: hypothetical protein JW912_03110 [Sedimentisphaerales bacterium]|nr:hypothetical protein [Sedimentisphaerales bacterium]